MSLAYEPAVPFGALLGSASWEDLDAVLSRALGRSAVAVPSVRVGLLWLAEHLGLSRHEHEILVPRFMSRCVLEALMRAAQPAAALSARTRLALVVHSFGAAPDWTRLRPALEERGLPFVEDASDALAAEERPARNSLGKFIALSKLLPAPKGGVFLTDRPELADLMRRRRAAPSGWTSWWIAAALAANRRGTRREGSPWVESAYALYPSSPGDNGALRAAMRRAVVELDAISAVEMRRLEALREACGPALLAPTNLRLLRAAPLEPRSGFARALEDCGFDTGLFHIDLASDPLSPRLVKALLVPLHPGVPEASLSRLAESLRRGAGELHVA